MLPEIIKTAIKDSIESDVNCLYTWMENTSGDTVEVSKDVLSSLLGTFSRLNCVFIDELL